jgi:hypothetical protein
MPALTQKPALCFSTTRLGDVRVLFRAPRVWCHGYWMCGITQVVDDRQVVGVVVQIRGQALPQVVQRVALGPGARSTRRLPIRSRSGVRSRRSDACGDPRLGGMCLAGIWTAALWCQSVIHAPPPRLRFGTGARDAGKAIVGAITSPRVAPMSGTFSPRSVRGNTLIDQFVIPSGTRTAVL